MGDQADYLIEQMLHPHDVDGYAAESRIVPEKVLCDYCNERTNLVDSSEVYNGKSYGLVYYCEPCEAWVGVHKGTTHPLGRLANKELRAAKMAAHRAFDPTWYVKGRSSTLNNRARRKAYSNLVHRLGIEPSKCHIAMFDPETCQRVIDLFRTDEFEDLDD